MARLPERGVGARAVTKTRFVLVRHGQTAWNATGRFQGQADVPLDAHGRAQAEALATELAELDADACYSSDLSRALETAELLAHAIGLEVTRDVRLREIHVGDWQGRTVAEVSAEHPLFRQNLKDRVDFRRSDTGETGLEAGSRVAGALAEYASKHLGQTVVVVGHGFAMRVGLALTLGLSFEQSFSLSGLWNASWTVVEHGRDWRLVHYNQVAAGHSGELASVNAP